MKTWMQVTLVVMGVVVILGIIFWASWRLNGRKTVKEHNLTIHMTGYALFPYEEGEPPKQWRGMLCQAGVLGANDSQLVFVCRYQDDSYTHILEHADVARLETLVYDRAGFPALVQAMIETEEARPRYLTMGMAGISLSRRVPQFLASRALCRVYTADGFSVLFSYKETPEHIRAMEDLKEWVLGPTRSP